jgi:hypothetical protein
MKNARFFDWINGDWVKITLAPGQTLKHWKWTPTDEGYHAEENTWTHNFDHVTATNATDGRDCDGRHSTEQTATCPLADLAAKDCHHEEGRSAPTHKRPAWQHGGSSQRDHTAESMNY